MGCCSTKKERPTNVQPQLEISDNQEQINEVNIENNVSQQNENHHHQSEQNEVIDQVEEDYILNEDNIIPSASDPVKFEGDLDFYNTDTIDFALTKEEKRIYKYSCPICFRLFTNILVSSCCNNYICVPCALDLNTRLKKLEKTSARCHFCGTDNLVLKSVDPSKKIKRYTDSEKNSTIRSKILESQVNFKNTFKKRLQDNLYSNSSTDLRKKNDYLNNLFPQTFAGNKLNIQNNDSQLIQKQQFSYSTHNLYIYNPNENKFQSQGSFYQDQQPPSQNQQFEIQEDQDEESSISQYEIVELGSQQLQNYYDLDYQNENQHQ